MSFRTAIIAIGDTVYKNVLGPRGLDLTPYFLTVRTRTWATGRKGQQAVSPTPNFTDVDLALGNYFPIRLVSAREIDESGGRFARGDVIVEDISPPGDGGVGYSAAQLKPSVPNDGVEIIYVITPTNAETVAGLAGNYDLREGQFDDWQYYQLVLRRRRDTP